MALTYSQFIYGFEVFDSGLLQNNLLDFNRGGVKVATLIAGVYTAQELAEEVMRVLEIADPGPLWAVSFDFSTLKFRIASNFSYTLLWGSGVNKTVDCSGLLGFVESDQASSGGSDEAFSDVAVGTAPTSTAKLWTMVEPNSKTTPVSAQEDGTTANLLQREVAATQSRSDGGSVETTYKHTMKRVTIGFKALTDDEQLNMESFLDWIEQGRRFNWQPNKDSPNALRLVVADPKAINNDFTWLTRSETDYGDLTFLEQVSRT